MGEASGFLPAELYKSNSSSGARYEVYTIQYTAIISLIST